MYTTHLSQTQQCQTKKLTVIGGGKGNYANAQPGFSGDGVVFSEARTKGSSGSYSEDGCFCYYPRAQASRVM